MERSSRRHVRDNQRRKQLVNSRGAKRQIEGYRKIMAIRRTRSARPLFKVTRTGGVTMVKHVRGET